MNMLKFIPCFDKLNPNNDNKYMNSSLLSSIVSSQHKPRRIETNKFHQRRDNQKLPDIRKLKSKNKGEPTLDKNPKILENHLIYRQFHKPNPLFLSRAFTPFSIMNKTFLNEDIHKKTKKNQKTKDAKIFNHLLNEKLKEATIKKEPLFGQDYMDKYDKTSSYKKENTKSKSLIHRH